MSYYQVPAGVLEDRDELIIWGRRAVEVGRASRTRTARGSRAKKRQTRTRRSSRR
jgi:TfoX/Sxy family transcriptional regulator of competence genes